MNVKHKLVIFVLMCVFAVSLVLLHIQKEIKEVDKHSEGEPIDGKISDVVDETFEKYEAQQSEIINGGRHASISITVHNEDDVSEVERYLKSNLSEDDLNNYAVNVFANSR